MAYPPVSSLFSSPAGRKLGHLRLEEGGRLHDPPAQLLLELMPVLVTAIHGTSRRPAPELSDSHSGKRYPVASWDARLATSSAASSAITVPCRLGHEQHPLTVRTGRGTQASPTWPDCFLYRTCLPDFWAARCEVQNLRMTLAIDFLLETPWRGAPRR